MNPVKLYIPKHVTVLRLPWGCVILDGRDGRVYRLNEEAAEILELIHEWRVDELNQLVRRREDVKQFIVEAFKRGHVRIGFAPFVRRGVFKRLGRMLPWHIDLELTSDCNASCPYCYLPRERRYMDFGRVKAAVEEVLRVDGRLAPLDSIMLTGGEPLLHPDVSSVIEWAAGVAERVIILTNGLLLERYAEVLGRLGERAMVQVSIDSLDPGLYSRLKGVPGGALDKVLAGLDKLASSDVKLFIAVPVSKLNIDDVDETVEKLRERYPTATIRVAPVFAIGPASSSVAFTPREIIDEYRERLVELARRYGLVSSEDPAKRLEELGLANCGAGWARLTIGPDGGVRGCPLWPLDARLGSVDELAEILSAGRVSRLSSTPGPGGDECGTCEYREWCGRCVARALWASRLTRCMWLERVGGSLGLAARRG